MVLSTHDSLCPKASVEMAFCACEIIERARLSGFKAGVLETGWVCVDCGNTYESSVDECPNKNLDSIGATEMHYKYVDTAPDDFD